MPSLKRHAFHKLADDDDLVPAHRNLVPVDDNDDDDRPFASAPLLSGEHEALHVFLGAVLGCVVFCCWAAQSGFRFRRRRTRRKDY